uniref:AAA family ATPase n=1 Tax=Trichocoleus desertorum TaxID=1481672 RepID=UPI0025B2F880|nr:AAA family ATPase [Trichocoleus desertorum]
MLTIPGYHVTAQIYESTNSLIYRGHSEADLQPVILKTLKQNYPTPDELTRYRQEYKITHSLYLDGVIKAYNIQSYQNRLVIFLEDFGGESLKHWMATRCFSWPEVLTWGSQIAKTLGQIHQQQIIHKDINPSNIVLNPGTGQLKLIDFGIATQITRENPTVRNPNLLEGTLAYLSPEQTGRMNRSLDYRTDFYSLGVTLYELLTQQLPFTADDELGLVHCHLAKYPIPPHDRNPAIPPAVSAVVMKLLAKTAEERYQSSWGIQADLEACLTQWHTGSAIAFPLAQHDVSGRFEVPQKLYGREREVADLLAAFRRVTTPSGDRSGKVSELLLVSGYAGIGKTSLVQEIYKPMTQRRGYFVAGKFDQYQRDIPYSAFVVAFAALVRQLLAESPAQLSHWQAKLIQALTPNAQVIIEVIPELAMIVGQQPPVTALPPAEARNRFNRTFQNLIQVLAQPEHPLVIFLDDLQWADAASLQLMQLLMATAGQTLLLIGAYRDNEVSPTHPLMSTVREIQEAGGVVNHISLAPLLLSNIQQLLGDTLHCGDREVDDLAYLLLAKTDGNPFFINEFLQALYAEGLLTFNYQRGEWQWSMAQIQQQNITDNVVELLIGKVKRLPAIAQAVLRRAACIGNQFDLQTLTFVLVATGVLDTVSFSAAIALLKEAIATGLIFPLNDIYKRVELEIAQPGDELQVEYKFVHDRIQQAAYSLNSATEQSLIHYHIGQQLLQNTLPEQQSQKLFDIVNQQNLGQALIKLQSERDKLAQLNLQAGQKAKASSAYSSAFRYLQVGLNLLAGDSWQSQYQLTLALSSEATEAAYLSGHLEDMERLSEIVLQQVQSSLDKIKVYEVKIQAYAAQTQFLGAIQMAREALHLLGVSLPKQATASDIQLALEETTAKLAGRQIESLIDLPLMQDAIAPAMMQILASANAPAYQAAPDLFPLIILKMVNLSLDYGSTALSPLSYALYAILLGGIVLDIELSYRFGQLALNLLEQFDNNSIRCRTLFVVNTSVKWRKTHLRETIQPLQEAYQLGIDNGDIEFAGYSILHHCDHLFFMGLPLAELKTKLDIHIHALTQLQEVTNTNALKVYQQTILHLIQPVTQPGILIGEVYSEAEDLPFLQQANHQKGLFYLYFNKLLLCYLFEDFQQAIAYADQLNDYLDGGRANAVFPLFYFYASLAQLAVYSQVSSTEQAALLEKVNANQELMRVWASHAPMNYLHKWYLVAAEQHRVLGEDVAAMEAYDRAATLAQEQEYIQEAALAYERAAHFYLAKGRILIAKAYLQEAWYGYCRWGATAKLQDLERRYPDLLQQPRAPESVPAQSSLSMTTTGSRPTATLDLITVMKASQVLSGEINLSKLLAHLMTILLENAGAETGTLLLERRGQLQIEVIGRVDSGAIKVEPAALLEDSDQLPFSIIQYVARTQENVVLHDAAHPSQFVGDRYLQTQRPKSVMCIPIQGHGKLIGILYLENNLTTDVFTTDRLSILQLLTSQAAIALENAQLYEQLADYSQTLEVKNQELEQEVSDRRHAENQLKAALLEKEVLLKEIHHRVKNNLQIISGLLQLQAHSVSDPQTIQLLRESQNRIESMSLIHKKLYFSSEFGQIDLADYIPSLTTNLVMSYQVSPGAITLDTSIDSIILNIDQAIPCGLIVNELVSNALKYAFPHGQVGNLQISLKTLPDSKVELIIQDDGVGLPEVVDWQHPQSLGLSLVRDLAIEQLEGSLMVERYPGTTFTIKFPQAVV